MIAEDYLKEHGITNETAKKFGLIWDRDRIVIPVKDEDGETIYNKYRHLNFDPNDPLTKKYSFDKGSHTTIFNVQTLKEGDYVFLTEGEMDCILLEQEGIKAVTNTAGASTFKDEWIPLFENKKVYVVYDSDEAGQEGARKVIEKLPAAFNILLPEETKDVCEFFQAYGKTAFRELVTKQVAENTITYDQLCAVFDKWLLLPDKNVIRILLAVLIAHHFTNDPLWIFFVAPPSGSKTEIINTITDLAFTHVISDLTPQTLASGMMTKEDPSLLLKLKDGILIMKDFTTVLSMKQENRQVILSQLREIYDGRYSKAFGTGKILDWQGRISFIAGVTTIIDVHSSIFQIMGERFIMYRVPQSNDIQVAKRAITNSGQEKEMREELKNSVKKYFLSLTIYPSTEIAFPEEIQDALAALASFIVRARSGIIRDSYKKELQYIPSPEAPSRLAKQLCTMVKALAVQDRRKEVTWDDYYLTLKIALDGIPANRMAHITAVCGTSMIETTQVAQRTEYPTSGASVILEDLTALKILKVKREGAGHANTWGLSAKTKDYFKQILPVHTDKIYKYIPVDHEYTPLIKEMMAQATFTDIEVPEDMDLAQETLDL